MARKPTTKPPKTPKPATIKTKALTPKPKGKPNASILAFFQKVDPPEQALFVQGKTGLIPKTRDEDEDDDLWEIPAPTKRQKVSGEFSSLSGTASADPVQDCTPPPPVNGGNAEEGQRESSSGISNGNKPNGKRRAAGPFLLDSDSEDDAQDDAVMKKREPNGLEQRMPRSDAVVENDDEFPTSSGDFEGFEDIEDFEEDDLDRDEEYQDKKFYERQRQLEQEQRELEAAIEASTLESQPHAGATGSCPICNQTLEGLSTHDISIHVNSCLDGTSADAPEPAVKQETLEVEHTAEKPSRPLHPPKPGQRIPFLQEPQKVAQSGPNTSAFSKLMSNNAEDGAWKSAAASEVASRGKQSYERTCPFYKIMPGFSICVDAFRYGAVEGCKAYFLSHFHSDHYIGLTSTWSHGPIYCSKVTGNLVRQQLRVNPKYVVDLEFEQETEVPEIDGARVTMIPANHCPGSSLFLFEKAVGKGKNARVQRILHCGDFRACRKHIEHPLLRPDALDTITGKTHQQKIDVCYLDTTYLNPKYAFPSQEAVISACAQMCAHINSNDAKADNLMEYGSRDRADAQIQKFITSSKSTDKSTDTSTKPSKVLVVVGTYSIGKERICLGIARALKSKIYAPAPKRRICACLEDPELDALLTDDPRQAQVHMTPLFELRPDTLADYGAQFGDTFARVVGFRPTGWNYRPPGSRVDAPTVSTVLHGANWKSGYGARDLVAQRGSTKRSAVYGVPYSEHSSFRELSMFCCALRIDRIVPTVNVGSAKSRERMRMWVERWMAEKKKNGLFKAEEFD